MKTIIPLILRLNCPIKRLYLIIILICVSCNAGTEDKNFNHPYLNSTVLFLPDEQVRIDHDSSDSNAIAYIPVAINVNNEAVKISAKGTKYIVTAQAFDKHGIALADNAIEFSKEIILLKGEHESGGIEIINHALIDEGFIVIYVNGIQQNKVVSFYLYNATNLIKYDKEIVFSPNKKNIEFKISLNTHYTDHDPDNSNYEVTAQLRDYNHNLFAESEIIAQNRITLNKENPQDIIRLKYKLYDDYLYSDYIQGGEIWLNVKKTIDDSENTYIQHDKTDFYAKCDPSRSEGIKVFPYNVSLEEQETKKIRFVNCSGYTYNLNLYAAGIILKPKHYFTLQANDSSNNSDNILLQITRVDRNSETCVRDAGYKDCMIKIINV